jgi:acyl-CoA hydrolase
LAPDPSTTEETRFVEMIFPEQANHYGTLFGRHALRPRAPVVMATSEKVEFHVPVRVGELFEWTAQVTRVGRSSMTVAIEAASEGLVTGTRRLAVRGSFEMVAVDQLGKPVPIARFPSIEA